MPVEVTELNVFVRSPLAGRVKTRLAASVGRYQALQIYRFMLQKTLQDAATTQMDVKVLAAGGCSHPSLRQWCAERELPLTTQSGGNLGRRMSRCLRESILSHGRGMVIGSDCPALGIQTLDHADGLLKAGHDLVLGPAIDGGYYLIGMSRHCPDLFRNIAWGGSTVLRSTLKIATKKGLKTALLDPLNDVDTLSDWKAYLKKVGGPSASYTPAPESTAAAAPFRA